MAFRISIIRVIWRMGDFQVSFDTIGEAVEWVRADKLHDTYSLYDTRERLKMRLCGSREDNDLEFVYQDGLK